MYVKLFLLDKLEDEFFINSVSFPLHGRQSRQLLLYCLVAQYKPGSKTNARFPAFHLILWKEFISCLG